MYMLGIINSYIIHWVSWSKRMRPRSRLLNRFSISQRSKTRRLKWTSNLRTATMRVLFNVQGLPVLFSRLNPALVASIIQPLKTKPCSSRTWLTRSWRKSHSRFSSFMNRNWLSWLVPRSYRTLICSRRNCSKRRCSRHSCCWRSHRSKPTLSSCVSRTQCVRVSCRTTRSIWSRSRISSTLVGSSSSERANAVRCGTTTIALNRMPLPRWSYQNWEGTANCSSPNT
jgi:hypothetical protein